jgi:hypothetical protein
VENYTYNAYDPNIRSRIFFSIVNGSRTRATAGTLRSIEALLWYVNYDYLNRHQNDDITIEFVPVNEVEPRIHSLPGKTP